MKYKIICVVVVITMIFGSFMFQNIKIDNNRHHQHLDAHQKEACTDHGKDVFCTHLPLMNIVTDAAMPDAYVIDEYGNKTSNEEFVGATIQYFDNEYKNNHLEDEPTISERATIRIRGASSRGYDKKSYLIKFKHEDMVNGKRVSLSGMTADSEWVLNGPFVDKTLIRNYLCYNLAGEIMEYSPNVRFCEAYLNGEYIGLYLLMEKVEYNSDGRINIERTDEDMDVTSYIVEIDRKGNDAFREIDTFAAYSYLYDKSKMNAGHMKIVYPSTTLTEEQRNYIISDISQFEKSLYSFAYSDDAKGYRNYIDVESFVDYFLINEFTLNYDAQALSRYVYKDIGGKLKMCVWDFNLAFDYYETSVVSPETFVLQSSMWYNQLFKDEAFVNQVVQRYMELRDEYFNEEYLYQYIDETIAYLGPAIERNYDKWGYSFNSEYNGKNYDFLVPIERNVRSYDEAVAQLKSCIRDRIQHMDANLDRLYLLSHDSLNKKYNYDKEAGY